MFPLFETIRISNGKRFHLEWHQRRLEQSCKSYYGRTASYQISNVIRLPDETKTGLFKLRFFYSPDRFQFQIEPYFFKKITTLKMIRADHVEYALKYTDRSILDKLGWQKGSCDEILIVKNGRISDTSFANIIFFDRKKWLTPQTPLLKGTCRERLLHEKKIFEADIKPENLNKFTHFKLINAMRDFDETESERVKKICPLSK